jgi:hypothetical protein
MKRTNSLLSTFWVKAVPVFLLLICIGFTNARAQNYKPLPEAVTSVNTALNSLKSQKFGTTLNVGTPGSPKTNGMTPAQAADTQVKVFEVSYFERFLQLAKENNDVALAVQALDAEFAPYAQQQGRSATITNGRNDLMHLITW